MVLELANVKPVQILDDNCSEFDPVDRLVRDYAAQVPPDNTRLGDAMFDQLRILFGLVQILELTLRITLCIIYNDFNEVK